jgi:D-xylose reductase
LHEALHIVVLFCVCVFQVERHAYLQQPKLTRYCTSEGIPVVGFSPLGSSSYVEIGMATASDSPLTESAVEAIAEAHGKTPAQVLLRWGIQSSPSSGGGDQFAVIPKSSNPKRLAENIGLFDFKLSEDEMAALSALDKNTRFNDPGEFTQGMNSFCPIFD